MPEPVIRQLSLSDGYPIHMTTWNPDGPARGQAVVLHGVQSHAGWYHRLGRNLSEAGWIAHFPDRRGSGSNTRDRGHAASAGRLFNDVRECLQHVRAEHPRLPVTLGGISWGGKLALVAAARDPNYVQAVALICPGLMPQVGVPPREVIPIFLAWVQGSLTGKHREFPIPLGDPALFTSSETWQQFIADDPLGLRRATGSLLAASRFIDLRVQLVPKKVQQPILLMLAEHDRIVDNMKTLRYFERVGSTNRQIIHYPGAHHTLEFENDPDRYAHDLIQWMDRVLLKPTPSDHPHSTSTSNRC